jgi:hypothetical protein
MKLAPQWYRMSRFHGCICNRRKYSHLNADDGRRENNYHLGVVYSDIGKEIIGRPSAVVVAFWWTHRVGVGGKLESVLTQSFPTKGMRHNAEQVR